MDYKFKINYIETLRDKLESERNLITSLSENDSDNLEIDICTNFITNKLIEIENMLETLNKILSKRYYELE